MAEDFCTGVFKAGVNVDSAFYKRESSGETKGISHDILMELGHRSGCAFVESPVNYSRALDDFKYSRLDLFAVTFPNPAWTNYADHKIIYSFERVMLVKKSKTSKPIVLSDYIDDKKIKFGSVIGAVMFFTAAENEQLTKDKRIVDAADADGAVKLLLSNKVQMLFVSPVYVKYLKMTDKDFDKKMAYSFDSSNMANIGIYISKTRVSKANHEILTSTLEKMKSDGAIIKILKKYIESEDLIRYH
jgi:ABC-type amino acid transport substrate-binding protein